MIIDARTPTARIHALRDALVREHADPIDALHAAHGLVRMELAEARGEQRNDQLYRFAVIAGRCRLLPSAAKRVLGEHGMWTGYSAEVMR